MVFFSIKQSDARYTFLFRLQHLAFISTFYLTIADFSSHFSPLSFLLSPPLLLFSIYFLFRNFHLFIKKWSFLFFFRSRFHIWTLLMRSGDVRCQPMKTFFSIILLSDIIFLSLVFLLPQNFLHFFKMFHFFFFLLYLSVLVLFLLHTFFLFQLILIFLSVSFVYWVPPYFPNCIFYWLFLSHTLEDREIYIMCLCVIPATEYGTLYAKSNDKQY